MLAHASSQNWRARCGQLCAQDKCLSNRTPASVFIDALSQHPPPAAQQQLDALLITLQLRSL